MSPGFWKTKNESKLKTFQIKENKEDSLPIDQYFKKYQRKFFTLKGNHTRGKPGFFQEQIESIRNDKWNGKHLDKHK